MATYFISDLHLSSETENLNRLFHRFLTEIAEDADRLYILGDLFEVWFGDDAIDQATGEILSQLQSLAKTTELFFQPGNRDFLVSQRFESLSGASILPDIQVINLYGTATLIMHGDLLCTDDLQYMAFRKQVRNPQWIEHFLSLDIAQRIAMAKQARSQSQEGNAQKSEQIMDANPNTVEQYMNDAGVYRLIHGHTHRPAIHHLKINDLEAKRIVLGDWQTEPSYIRVDETGLELVDPRVPRS